MLKSHDGNSPKTGDFITRRSDLSTMISEAICAEHQSWSTGAVATHKFRAIGALPFAIFCLARYQSSLNDFIC